MKFSIFGREARAAAKKRAIKLTTYYVRASHIRRLQEGDEGLLKKYRKLGAKILVNKGLTFYVD